MCGGGGGGGYTPIENRSDDELRGMGAPSRDIPVLDENGNGSFYYDDWGSQIFQTNPNENYDSQLEEYNSAQAELQRRQQVKDQLAAQAAERENILKAQREQAAEMERQQAAIIAQQEAEATRLQAQQAERVAGIRTAGNAVTQSLQILGNQPGKQAPTAASAAPNDKKATARMAPASGLRIGSTQTGSGAGANVAI
jgi:hypothetical protein